MTVLLLENLRGKSYGRNNDRDSQIRESLKITSIIFQIFVSEFDIGGIKFGISYIDFHILKSLMMKL